MLTDGEHAATARRITEALGGRAFLRAEALEDGIAFVFADERPGWARNLWLSWDYDNQHIRAQVCGMNSETDEEEWNVVDGPAFAWNTDAENLMSAAESAQAAASCLRDAVDELRALANVLDARAGREGPTL